MTKQKERKEQIIQAAIEVFGKKGYADGSISEIAQRADVAEGTIYQYFKNKEDLFFSIPGERTREFSSQFDLHLEGITGASNKIGKLIWFYLYFFQTNPEYARTLMLEMRIRQRFAKSETFLSLKQFTDRVLQLVREGQDEGVIRKDLNPYLVRQLILGLLEHMVTRWLIKGESYDVLSAYKEATDLVFNGIKPTNGPTSGEQP